VFYFEVLEDNHTVASDTLTEVDPDSALRAALTALMIFSSRRPELAGRLSIVVSDRNGDEIGRAVLPLPRRPSIRRGRRSIGPGSTRCDHA